MSVFSVFVFALSLTEKEEGPIRCCVTLMTETSCVSDVDFCGAILIYLCDLFTLFFCLFYLLPTANVN